MFQQQWFIVNLQFSIRRQVTQYQQWTKTMNRSILPLYSELSTWHNTFNARSQHKGVYFSQIFLLQLQEYRPPLINRSCFLSTYIWESKQKIASATQPTVSLLLYWQKFIKNTHVSIWVWISRTILSKYPAGYKLGE